MNVADGLLFLFSGNVIGNQLHGAGSVKGDHGDNVFKLAGLQLFEIMLHHGAF